MAVTSLLGLVVFLPFLGYSGLSQSEGHRAVPGWEMLESGRWFPTTLFGYPYLRKPPGMPWAIAAAASLLGESAFSARAVSALATIAAATISAMFAAAWFGTSRGIIAGIAYICTPLFWYPGRSAEIEASHNLAVLLCVLVMVSIARQAWRKVILESQRPGLLNAVPTPGLTFLLVCKWFIFALSLAAMGLTKGPAGLPAVIAAIVLICVVAPAWWRVRGGVWWWGLAGSLLFASAILAYVASVTLASLTDAPPPIIEPPGHFLWNSAGIGDIMLLPIAAFISAFPTSLGLLVLVRYPSLRMGTPGRLEERTGYLLGAIVITSIVFYVAVGVANDRYAMPPLALCPIVLAAGLYRWSHASTTTALNLARARLAAPWVVLMMLVFAASHHAWLEHRRDQRTSGEREGRRLASLVPHGARIEAFEMIDQRPELLWYLYAQARDSGKHVTVRWRPYPAVLGTSAAYTLAPPGTYVVVRTDDRPRDQYPPEFPQFERAGGLDSSTLVTTGRVHNFTFSLYLMVQPHPSQDSASTRLAE